MAATSYEAEWDNTRGVYEVTDTKNGEDAEKYWTVEFMRDGYAEIRNHRGTEVKPYAATYKRILNAVRRLLEETYKPEK